MYSRFGKTINFNTFNPIWKYTIALSLFSLSQKSKYLYLHSENQTREKTRDPLWRSKTGIELSEKYRNNVLIFSGNGNKLLGIEVAERLGLKLGNLIIKKFEDSEINLQVLESIRGKDVFIIQPTCSPSNDNLMELLLLISTMKRTSAKKITAVIPYYGYARADRKMSSRVPISAADVAKMLETMGVDRVISVDLHSGQIQGFFGPHIPVDNLEAQCIMVEYLLNSNLISDYNNLVIVSPDAGGVYRAKAFADNLTSKTDANIGLTMIIKQRVKPNEVAKMELVGNVKDCECIIVDDMIDTAGTLKLAADELYKNGAKKVYAFATHGLFSGKAIHNINNSKLDKVVVTNTIPFKHEGETDKIIILSIGTLLAEAIRRIVCHESLSDIFIKLQNYKK